MKDASVKTARTAYFEPPSRLQLLDKLQHLVRYSDFLLLVSGERGAGKSTLLQQLCPQPDDGQLAACLLNLEKPAKDRDILPQLIAQLPVHETAGQNYSEQLHIFHQQLQALSAAGQKCLILVDNAELLTDSALDLLLNLHASSTEDQSVQLVLFADIAFASRLSANELIRHLEGRMHNLLLLGMKDEEIREFLEACVPQSSRINLQKRNEIIRLSGGMPGRAIALLEGQGQQLMRRMFPLPPLHMAGIGIILLAVLMLSMWQFLPEDKPASAAVTASDRVALPLSVQVKEAKSAKPAEISVQHDMAADMPVYEVAKESALAEKEPPGPDEVLSARPAEPEVIAPPREIVADLPEPESEPVPEVAAKLPEPVLASMPEPAVPMPEPEVTKTVAPAPVEVVEAPVQPAAQLSDYEKKLLQWPAKGYTLQMLGARKESSAIDFIKNQPNPDDFYYFATLYKGKPWYVVIYGQYSNRDVASSAIRKLPEALQKIRPWARSVQSVHLDIKKKIDQ